MKKILFFLILLFTPIVVSAEDIFLNKLTIKNGELSLPFDSYNTEYTVTLEENEFSLELDYEVNEGVNVVVNNNYDLENDSVVTLTISKENSNLNYHLHILKTAKESITTFNPIIEEKETFMCKYKNYIIPLVCTLFIIILYKILFRKHKKKII